MTKDTWFVPSERNKDHPAVFPQEIPGRLIALFTHAPDSVVLDPFCGAGTTGLACVKTGRDFIGIEQNPAFASIAASRISTAVSQIALPGLEAQSPPHGV